MQKMSPVVHFEFPAANRERAAAFYTKAFGWQTKFLGEDMMNYSLVRTTESNEQGHPMEPGRINGGFYQTKPELPAQYPSVVIGVEDIRASMEQIKAAGGEVLGEPMEIPGFGLYVTFNDTEGNRVSMMQPFMPQQ